MSAQSKPMENGQMDIGIEDIQSLCWDKDQTIMFLKKRIRAQDQELASLKEQLKKG